MYPDSIQLKSSKGVVEIKCKKVLREIKGLRVTFDSDYQQHAAITKCFMDLFGFARCFLAKRALETLEKRGINAPLVLDYGKTSQGWSCLVTEKILNSAPISSVIAGRHQAAESEKLILGAIDFIASMHLAGVVQNDMHLGNFLVRDSKIYAIDTERMRFFPRPLSLKAGLFNLGILIIGLPEIYLHLEPKIIEAYCRSRQIEASPDVYRAAASAVETAKRKTAKRLAKKVFRVNKRVLVIRKKGYRALFARAFFTKDDAEKLVESLNFEFENTRIYPTVFEYNGVKYEVSGFVPQNSFMGFFNRITPLSAAPLASVGKARRIWLELWKGYWSRRSSGHPAAMIEIYSGLTVKRSFILRRI